MHIRGLAALAAFLLAGCATKPTPEQMWAEDQATCQADAENQQAYRACIERRALDHIAANAHQQDAAPAPGGALANPPAAQPVAPAPNTPASTGALY
jgi:ribosomal protein L12E/L44/L45/RPP1/RPP2